MEGTTHIVGGIAAGLTVATLTDYNLPLVVTAAAIGGLIPDIDHGKSKISTANPLMGVVSAAVNVLFKHRGFTHSILFMALIAWGLMKINAPPAITAGLIAGIASHNLLDSLTKRGIKLFYPMDITFKIPFNLTTGGAVEKVFMVGLLGYIAYVMYRQTIGG